MFLFQTSPEQQQNDEAKNELLALAKELFVDLAGNYHLINFCDVDFDAEQREVIRKFSREVASFARMLSVSPER